jgi:acetyltransferase-like isoleucine patch superfamily enzyme
MSEFFKGCVFYFINHILNKIPSRQIRMFFYSLLSKKNINRKASIGLGVRILDIRNIKIGAHSNINFESILDGRGDGIEIGENVDIAPQVNIWSLEHEPNDPNHAIRSGKVTIGDNCWLANRVTVLPNSSIGKNCVIGAGSLIKGEHLQSGVILGYKATKVKERGCTNESKLGNLRVFR